MIKIRMPDFPRKVETSKARMKKYFVKGKRKVPDKYNDASRYIWLKNKLYDVVEKEYVVANPVAAGTPNYAYVSGNEIYARMHERVRMKIVTTVKTFMRTFIAKTVPSREYLVNAVGSGPLCVRLTIRMQYGMADWDVDNHWIYHKCFLDTLRDMKLIPDDNVLHIREAGAVYFEPIPPNHTPELIFSIAASEPYPAATSMIELQEDRVNKSGMLIISPDEKKAYITVGVKKIIFGAAKDALRKLLFYCLNNNKALLVSKELNERYRKLLDEFAEMKVKIIIH